MYIVGTSEGEGKRGSKCSTQTISTIIYPPPNPTSKYLWTNIAIITWVSTSSAVPSSSPHHHLGPNSLNPEDGSSTFIQKLTSNFNIWCQNLEHFNLNNPHRQWGFRYSEIWCCVAGWVVPTTFMTLCSFKLSGTTHPTMQCHTQTDMNALKQCVTT